MLFWGVENSMPIHVKSSAMNYLRQHDRAWVFSLIGAVLLVYLPFLDNPFVFDDLPFMANAVSQYATSAFALELRWLPYATLGWTWGWFGETASAFRLGNVVLHAANGVLLFYFLRYLARLWVDGEEAKRLIAPGAWAGALVFVCHPVVVYAVAYVIQRSILMATMFVLIMLLTYACGLVQGKRRWLFVSVVAYSLAVLSKEHSVMAPAIAAALSAMLWSRVKIPYSALLLTWMAFLVTSLLVLLRVKGLIGTPYEMAFEVAGADSYLAQLGLEGVHFRMLHLYSALTQAGLFFKYWLLWIFPNPAWMSIDMRVIIVDSLRDWPGWGAMVAFGVYGAYATWLLTRRGMRACVGFALLYPWLFFLVEFSSIRVQEPFVLYRSYMWLPGVAMLVTLLLIRSRSQKAVAVMAVVALSMVPFSWNRLWTFSDSLHLWNDAALLLQGRDLVGADRIYYNRGNAELASEKWDMAIADYKKVIAINPGLQPAHLNLASAYYGASRYVEAVRGYSKAIELNPKDPLAHFGNALALKRLNDDESALRHMKTSCDLGNVVGCAIVSSQANQSPD